jgi:hypothetical protein
MPRGKRVKSQTKGVVMNVLEYFEETGKKGGCRPSIERTAKATGLFVGYLQ